jgi:hypothetical protein
MAAFHHLHRLQQSVLHLLLALLLACACSGLASCSSLPSGASQPLLDAQGAQLADELEDRWRHHPVLVGYTQALQSRNAALNDQSLAGHLFVIVPGWLHQSEPGTGADLARQRAALRALGAGVHVASVQENGSVEDNAVRVFNDLEQMARTHDSIIVLSASKGGPEAALALSELGQATHSAWAHRVKAWVNIGGTLRGTALADQALDWRVCWLISGFVVPGGSMEGIRSLLPERSRARYASVRIAPHVQVVNLLGIATAQQITARAKQGHALLSALGPNDGITLLRDAIKEDAPTVVLRGADHYFMLPDLDIHTVALAHGLVRTLKPTEAP